MVRKQYVYGTVFVNLVRVRVRVRVNMGFQGTGTEYVPVYAVRGMLRGIKHFRDIKKADYRLWNWNPQYLFLHQ